MINITAGVLHEIAPTGHLDIIGPVAEYLNICFPNYGIITRTRAAHFLAQAAHETDGFKTLTEYASGHAYENRKSLGNTQKGDGPRYKGRGIFQITGRANYRDYGDRIGIDLESDPERAAEPEIAARTALEFWKSKHLNAYADEEMTSHITKLINGGLNGLESRKAYLILAKKALKA